MQFLHVLHGNLQIPDVGRQVVGWIAESGGTTFADGNRAVSWQGGVLTDLHPAGSTSSRAYAVNDAGQVVGFVFDQPSSHQHATLWQGGVSTDLSPPGANFSVAYAINAAGDIAGARCHCRCSDPDHDSFAYPSSSEGRSNRASRATADAGRVAPS